MKKAAQTALPWLLLGLTGVSAGLLNGLLGAAGGILLVALLPRLTPPAALYPPAVPLGMSAAPAVLRRSPEIPGQYGDADGRRTGKA